MIISEKSLYFLLFQFMTYIVFYIINLLFMKLKPNYWKGLNCDDNNCAYSDSFYYTTATHTSIGFGDIIPKNRWIRIITSIHMLLVFILIILEFK